MTDATISEGAPAKINLALHVTGQRADGYHLLETLVTFAEDGDRLTFTAAPEDRVSLSGRFAASLPAADDDTANLVVRARDALRAALAARQIAAPPVHIHLEKNLPVASGIGGGSADAAATLRGLQRLWGSDLAAGALSALALALGADVPMCLSGRPLIASGIGETLTPVPGLPALALILANPLVAVPTPQVFRLLTNKANAPLVIAPAPDTPAGWMAALASLRNDLEPPARALAGEIAAISTLLAAQGALLVRMSGSGATCFGVFATGAQAKAAAAALHRARPDWYFHATQTIAGETS